MALVYKGYDVVDGVDGNATPLSGTVTVPTGTTYVMALTQAGDDLGQPDTTSITLDGDDMSSIGAQSDGSLASLPTTMEMFDLEDPTTGDVTCSVAYNLPPFTAYIALLFFSGEHATTPTEGFKTSTGTGTAVNLGVTTTTNSGDIIVGHVLANVAGLGDISSSDTEILEVIGTTGADIVIAVAKEDITGSGAEVNFTLGSSADWRGQAAVIKAAATGGISIPVVRNHLRNQGIA